MGCVTVLADDDAGSWRGVFGSESVSLQALGPAANLDGARLNAVARQTGCDAVHPRLRFSERTRGIRRSLRVGGSGLDWPDARATRPFGDKAEARALAARGGVPLAPGSAHAVSLEARVFFAAQNGAGVMIKAIGGGGGCGIRAVRPASDVEEAYRHSRQC